MQQAGLGAVTFSNDWLWLQKLFNVNVVCAHLVHLLSKRWKDKEEPASILQIDDRIEGHDHQRRKPFRNVRSRAIGI